MLRAHLERVAFFVICSAFFRYFIMFSAKVRVFSRVLQSPWQGGRGGGGGGGLIISYIYKLYLCINNTVYNYIFIFCKTLKIYIFAC